jgi:hypothetical protein
MDDDPGQDPLTATLDQFPHVAQESKKETDGTQPIATVAEVKSPAAVDEKKPIASQTPDVDQPVKEPLALPAEQPIKEASAEPNSDGARDSFLRDLEQGKILFSKQCERASKDLSEALRKEIESVRKESKLKPEDKQRQIAWLEAEQTIFEKYGGIPFSPAMRDATLKYLNALLKAEAALAKIYDRAVEFHTKHKNDEAARELLAEKKRYLAPKIVGKWLWNKADDPNFRGTEVFYSNGTTKSGTWTLDSRFLRSRTPDAKAPGGAWLAQWVIAPDGLQAESINNNRHKFKHKRITTE